MEYMVLMTDKGWSHRHHISTHPMIILS